jgi:hypothetical protein
MLTVLTRLNLWKNKNKKYSVLLSWFSGIHTLQHNRTDQTKCIVSQLGEAYARPERNNAKIAWLAGAG